MTTRVPDSMPADAVRRVRCPQAARSRGLAAGEASPPAGARRCGRANESLGLFAADDNGGKETGPLLASMPPRSWRTDDVTPAGCSPERPGWPGDNHRAR